MVYRLSMTYLWLKDGKLHFSRLRKGCGSVVFQTCLVLFDFTAKMCFTLSPEAAVLVDLLLEDRFPTVSQLHYFKWTYYVDLIPIFFMEKDFNGSNMRFSSSYILIHFKCLSQPIFLKSIQDRNFVGICVRAWADGRVRSWGDNVSWARTRKAMHPIVFTFRTAEFKIRSVIFWTNRWKRLH